jgi:hypothetical protein
MSDYDYLSRAELIEKIITLKQIISVKNKEQEEYEKCVARVNPTIQKKVEEQDIKLSDAFKSDLNSFQRIKELERTIEKQNAIISMAAGYISASKRFSSSHPMDVMKWLMGGM